MTKPKLAALSLLLGITIAVGGYFLTDEYFQNLAVEFSGIAIALSVGIFAVNMFLESKSKKPAVRSLLMLIDVQIRDFHNLWMDINWAEFGRDSFGDITREYVSADGRPEALSLDVRQKIYASVADNVSLLKSLRALEEVMVELSRFGGWSLDTDLLQHCLDFRRAAIALLQESFDGTEETVNAVVEHMFDADIHSGFARARLLELGGISDDE